MTEINQKPTLTFNDKNYVIEDLSDEAKHIINQMQDLANQIATTSNRLEQLRMSQQAYTDRLAEVIEGGEEEGAE